MTTFIALLRGATTFTPRIRAMKELVRIVVKEHFQAR